jgi:DNA processing protein
LYRIALTRIEKIGPILAKTLLAHCGSAESVFHTPRPVLETIEGVGSTLANNIRDPEVLRRAEAELTWIEAHGVRALFYLDDDYPERLRQLPGGPLLLYYRGTARLNARRTVAVVGTRRPSPEGLRQTEELIEQLAPYEPLILSGLAYGIDAAAHRAALAAGLPTVGVLGHGLSRIYPPQHRKLALEMSERGGGLLTEFPSYARPDREHFPMRNRIVAGMSDAVVVVETARRGGSIITAQMANDFHRDVFAFPGRRRDPFTEGCNWLIKSHRAALVESGADLAYVLQWKATTPGEVSQARLFADLSDAERRVVDVLKKHRELPVDELAYRASLPQEALPAVLLELECKGLIQALPGNRYLLMR